MVYYGSISYEVIAEGEVNENITKNFRSALHYNRKFGVAFAGVSANRFFYAK